MTASLAAVPLELWMFAAILAAIAIFHRHTLLVSLIGVAAIALYKVAFTGFKAGPGLSGLTAHFGHEAVLLMNLLLLLTGFALLARHFEESQIPAIMPNLLPDNWTGGVALLALIFVMSAFLDNIAAAIIGGTVARSVFRGRVHIGYLAAIVAASNAGGSGSVVGDTTTTMIWISGVSPLAVLEAYIAAAVAFVVFAIPAARSQHRYQPILKGTASGIAIVPGRIVIVLFILASAIAANVLATLYAPEILDHIPLVGLAVWAAILIAALFHRPEWSLLPEATKGSIFLLALVGAASMMPIDALPPASAATALTLGFVSAVFDNIPLTALAIKQGGYDWGYLAYAVGFGGSMIWFGSSAGVALTNLFPEARSVAAWLKAGWFIPLAYVAGFGAMFLVLGWSP
ncbi:citrate transporter [Hyphomicrobium sp. LHD-15]|uniref:citrate transporter n=1 Tax=Hyphomicrobium sp. LHD-15 TaxID=3072142 RepID=UPI002810934F|nr:citrate transporter [Hyphomicrobium sp. LHD-15]MDQ8700177.1 citrate transporter [Hyphomicrobium sp. LHD-15]